MSANLQLQLKTVQREGYTPVAIPGAVIFCGAGKRNLRNISTLLCQYTNWYLLEYSS